MTAGETAQPNRFVHGFAALGTDDLHTPPPPAPEEPPAPPPRAAAGTGHAVPAPGSGAAALRSAARSQSELLVDPELFQRTLGDELRTLRKGHGWTRKDLHGRLLCDPSLQTLATYELGTRHMSVWRLFELCIAMDDLPEDVLARVRRRILGDPADTLRARLADLAAADDPALAPIADWAAHALRTADSDADIRLGGAAVELMAELCALTPDGLVARLRHAAESGRDATADTDAPADHDARTPPPRYARPVIARRVGDDAVRWKTAGAEDALVRAVLDIAAGTAFLRLRRGDQETATLVAARPDTILVLGTSPLAAQLRLLFARPDAPPGLSVPRPPNRRTPLADLATPLSAGTRDVLTRAGFRWVDEADAVSPTRWKELPGLGPKRRAELARVLPGRAAPTLQDTAPTLQDTESPETVLDPQALHLSDGAAPAGHGRAPR